MPIKPTTRDLAFLRDIKRFGQLDREQIQARHFGQGVSAIRRTNRRLAAMRKAGLVVETPQLILNGGGDRPHVYSLSVDGAHLLGDTKRSRENTLGGFVLEHRRQSNSYLLHIESKAAERGWVADTQPERMVRAEIGRAEIPIPDGRFYLTAKGKILCGLLEADMGTEAKAKFSSKIRQYLDNLTKVKKAHGNDQIRVLVVTRARRAPLALTSDPVADMRRVDELRDFITEVSDRTELFLITTEREFLAGNPLTDPIWRLPQSPTPRTLL